MRLSVLDQSTAAQGHGQDEAIRDTLALPRHCDPLGYHRYSVSEHHNSDSIVGTAPEVLIAAIDKDVQELTWQAYMRKKLVRAKPLAHMRIFFKDLAHLAGVVRP